MFMQFVEPSTDPEAIRAEREAQHAEDDDVFAGACKTLVSLGLDIAKAVHQQVVAHAIDTPNTPVPEAALLGFERISRTIRRTIWLARKIREPIREPKPKPERPQPDPSQTLACAVDAMVKNPDRLERLYTGLRDTFDLEDENDLESDLDDDFAKELQTRRPIEALDEIRQDFGLPPFPLSESGGEGQSLAPDLNTASASSPGQSSPPSPDGRTPNPPRDRRPSTAIPRKPS